MYLCVCPVCVWCRCRCACLAATLFSAMRGERLGYNNILFVDELLRNMHIQSESSMNKFVKKLKSDGYCLKDGKRYGNRLSDELVRNPKLLVSKKEAKPFSYAKKCLVNVF